MLRIVGLFLIFSCLILETNQEPEQTKYLPCLKREPCTPFYDHWSSCTKSCGGGLRHRSGRCCSSRCTKPITCVEECNTQSCNADGMWSSWSAWVEISCSESCCTGVANRTRTRTCTNPPPTGSGADCDGEDTEVWEGGDCNTQICPVMCMTDGQLLDNPCEACTPIYFRCEGGNATQEMCMTPGEVWSTMFNTCITLDLCQQLSG